MKKTLKKVVSYLLMISAVFGFNVFSAKAAGEVGLLKNATLFLSDTRPDTPANYTFTMTTANSSTTFSGVKLEFKTKPTNGAKPAGGAWNVEGTKRSAIPFEHMGNDTDWTLDKATQGDNGILFLENATGADIAADQQISFTIDAITNPDISDTGCQRRTEDPADANSSTGTCYVKISTYNTADPATMMNASTTPIDTTTISYTIVNEITVSAKVDPAFSFMVAGVPKTTTINQSDDGAGNLSGGVSTTNDSTYNTLPFANLQPGNKRYLAQDITVNTNAMNGYTITMSMRQEMVGKYGSKIDEFKGVAPDHNAAWNAPQAWTAPDGNGTDTDLNGDKNTGWLGAATSDKRVGGWSSSNQGLWGPLGLDDATHSKADTVMTSTGPELNKTARISFILDVNVYQPSDQYTGYLQYNCVPKY